MNFILWIQYNWKWSKHQFIKTDPKIGSIIESKSFGNWEAAFKRKEYSLHHNKLIVLQFKVDGDTTRAHFFIENGRNGEADYRRFGVIAKYGKLCAEYNILGKNNWVENVLLGTLRKNQWYTLKIGIDDKHGFRIYVKAEEEPIEQSFYVLNKIDGIRGLKWRFLHHIYAGSAYIANYSEWKGTIKEAVFYNADRLPGKKPEIYLNKSIDPKSGYINTIFSADGKEFYFCGGIHCIKFKNGKWGSPVDLGIPGVDVMLTPDENKLFFCSTRLKPPICDTLNGKYQLWYCKRQEGSWGGPIYLPEPINYPDFNQIYPSFDNSGNLYFKSDRPGGNGGLDLYVSKLINGKYLEPENLGSVINTKHDEGDAFIAPDASFIIFPALKRKENYGSGDLYISFKKEDTTISMVQHIMLTYYKRIYYQQSLGGIFENIQKQQIELDLVTKIVEILRELINCLCDISGIDYMELQTDLFQNESVLETFSKLLPKRFAIAA